MPVPKRKRSHSRKNKRLANKRFALKAFTHCPNCKEVLSPHQVCQHCGFYKGVKIIMTKADRALIRGKAKKTKSERQKVMQQAQETEQEKK